MLQQNMGPIMAAKYTHKDKGAVTVTGDILTRYILSWYAVVSISRSEKVTQGRSPPCCSGRQGNAACGIELCHTSCKRALHCISPHSSFGMPGYKCACTVCKCSALTFGAGTHHFVCMRLRIMHVCVVFSNFEITGDYGNWYNVWNEKLKKKGMFFHQQQLYIRTFVLFP